MAEPLIAAKTLKNKPRKIATGKKTVVQFWASWCLTCGETMQKIYKMTRKNKKVRFYGIGVDENLSAMKNYIKAKPYMNKFRRNLLWDSDTSFAEKLEVEAVPTIIIFDKSGKQIYKREGKPEAIHLKEIRKIVRG